MAEDSRIKTDWATSQWQDPEMTTALSILFWGAESGYHFDKAQSSSIKASRVYLLESQSALEVLI